MVIRKQFSNHCVFVKNVVDENFTILLLYVYDILIVGVDSKNIHELKKEVKKSFVMKDLGP